MKNTSIYTFLLITMFMISFQGCSTDKDETPDPKNTDGSGNTGDGLETNETLSGNTNENPVDAVETSSKDNQTINRGILGRIDDFVGSYILKIDAEKSFLDIDWDSINLNDLKSNKPGLIFPSDIKVRLTLATSGSDILMHLKKIEGSEVICSIFSNAKRDPEQSKGEQAIRVQFEKTENYGRIGDLRKTKGVFLTPTQPGIKFVIDSNEAYAVPEGIIIYEGLRDSSHSPVKSFDDLKSECLKQEA